MLPDLSIRQLEYLVAVADAPTWAVAAAETGVSPSALSQGLAELERRVGIELFDREGRRRILRPAAREVLEHARRVLALTGDLARWAERVRTGTEGDVRLGMIDVAAVNHYPEVLRRFRDENPDVELRLRVEPSGSLLHDLVGGDLDLVVCVEPSVPARGGGHRSPDGRGPRRVPAGRQTGGTGLGVGPLGVVPARLPHPFGDRGRLEGGGSHRRDRRRFAPARGSQGDGRSRPGLDGPPGRPGRNRPSAPRTGASVDHPSSRGRRPRGGFDRSRDGRPRRGPR